jgi:hypothetical protein
MQSGAGERDPKNEPRALKGWLHGALGRLEIPLP